MASGEKDCALAGPLLVIAGAGSGKTNTLAHRVAHLIVNGADPRRILLMTFSRRAAAEMTRRVERICAQAMGANAGIMTDALAWAGTFHGIGARILRDYAEQIGLDPGFTIHDREDSADLMNLARHELGFSKTESRFPTKGTCLAIYSRAVNAELPLEEVLRISFPWCAGWRAQLRDLFAAYVEAKQAQNVLDYDDLLLYWAQTVGEPALAEDIGGRFDHVLVDEYQDTNRLQSSILLALKPGGRGLTVVGDDAQSIYSFRAATVRNILDFPNAVQPRRRHHHARPELSLDAADPCRRQWRDRTRLGAFHQESLDRAPVGGASAARHRARRDRPGPLHRRASAGEPGKRHRPQTAGRVVSRVTSQRPAGIGTDPPQHSLRQIRRAEVSGQRPRQGHAGGAAVRPKPARPGRGFPAHAAYARRRADFGAARPRPGWSTQSDPIARSVGNSAAAARRATTGPASSQTLQHLRSGKAGWPAEVECARRWYEPHLERIHEDAATRLADLLQLEQIASGYPSRERFLTELTLDPPDATSDQAGAPLLDEDYLILSTIHSAKGQEWKSVFVLNAVDGCIPSDLGAGTTAEIEEERRLLYVAMTRAKDESAYCRAAALLYPWPACPGRSPCLRLANPLHPGEPARLISNA